MTITKLSHKELRKQIDLKSMGFKTTKDLPELDSIIGQKRAIEAITFALEMKSSGYNVYVSGISGTGKATIVKNIITEMAQTYTL